MSAVLSTVEPSVYAMAVIVIVVTKQITRPREHPTPVPAESMPLRRLSSGGRHSLTTSISAKATSGIFNCLAV
ncbi:hypothetical protein TYRP_000499 [Tyrophagus putrescentiae]|nr:hypothetical protein TYRP_000499 [Tyrophagus putrescentiae]